MSIFVNLGLKAAGPSSKSVPTLGLNETASLPWPGNNQNTLTTPLKSPIHNALGVHVTVTEGVCESCSNTCIEYTRAARHTNQDRPRAIPV